MQKLFLPPKVLSNYLACKEGVGDTVAVCFPYQFAIKCCFHSSNKSEAPRSLSIEFPGHTSKIQVPKRSMQLGAMGIVWVLVYDPKSLAVRSRVLDFSISCQLDILNNVLEARQK